MDARATMPDQLERELAVRDQNARRIREAFADKHRGMGMPLNHCSPVADDQT
jgi:hypothetical protein